MFRELRLTKFKSFAEEQTIPFAPVTLFVGANASGKSNALDALRFLQGLGKRLSIAECLSGKEEGGQQVHPEIRGGAAEACWAGENRFRIACDVSVPDDPLRFLQDQAATEKNPSTQLLVAPIGEEPLELRHEILININDSAVDMESLVEVMRDADTKHVISGCRNGEKEGQLIVGPQGRHLPLSEEIFDRSILYLSGGSRDFHPWPPTGNFLQALASTTFYDMQPSAMRGYVKSNAQVLGDRGQNLSRIVQRVCDDQLQKQSLLEWVNELTAPRATGFDFEETRIGDVLLYLVEEGDRKISARSLSDGTLRFLGYLAAVFSAKPGAVLVFEEIENGLHPTRVHLLIELFEQLAAERNIQIIATTHSSHVLLSLSREALENVVLFARDEEHPGTVVRRLGDLPSFDEVSQRTHIDELFTTGWLERAV